MAEESGFMRVYEFCAKKHNLLILRILLNRPHGAGFNAIMKTAGQITARILSFRLKELEKHKLVSKNLVLGGTGGPPKIEYRITAKAEHLRKALAELEAWGAKELG